MSLLVGVSATAILISSPAWAQTADQPPAPPPETTLPAEQQLPPTDNQPPPSEVSNPRPAATQPQRDQQIVITGSRIRRTEATSAAPLQIIDPTLSQRQGLNTAAEIIQSSPIASGSSQITSAISTNFVTNGGPGSQTIDLRGLGASRTLVLLNGRRAGPAGTRGGVTAFDLNVLPAGIIRSVEILKDGASSIYGSDAIAGVVNILTKKDTDGIELNISGNLHQHKGGEEFEGGATWGKDFGRGHILLSADYYKQNYLKRKDRKFLGCPEDYMFRPDGSRADLIDPRTGKPRCNGVVWGQVWTYYAYNLPDFGTAVLLQPDFGDGLAQYVPHVPGAHGYGELNVPSDFLPVGYIARPDTSPVDDLFGPSRSVANALENLYSPIEAGTSVIPKTKRITGYADASYEITDNIELYSEFLFNNRKTYTQSLVQLYNFGYAATAPFEGDPFPGFYQPEGGFVLVSPTNITDHYDNKIDVDYYRGVLGATGKLFGDWVWDAYGQYSHNVGKYTYDQILADSIAIQSYKTGSCVGEFTSVAHKACIDINWVDPAFLAGNLTQEQIDFLFGTETGKTIYNQKYFEASTTGTLFHLPAGPVGIAAGAAWRKDSIDDQPGNITMAPNPDQDPNDPDDDFIDNGYANPIASGHTFGHSVTKEAFAEINVPILKNFVLAKSLQFSGAARVTDVKATRGGDGFSASSKGNWTYKLQGNWQIVDAIRLRSTYGTSYRAPALFEQFLANQVSGARQVNIDPCVNWANGLAKGTITQRQADNCAADGISPTHSGAGVQAAVFNSGGVGVLEPETSRAFTASVILTPPQFLDTSVAFTVDYFDIKVKGEITQLGAKNIIYGCYASLDFPNDPLCSLFERGQVGDPTNVKNVFDKFINVNRQHNRGLDFTLRATHRLGGFGRLSFLGNATYQLKDDVTLFGGTIDNLNGEIGDPKLVADGKFTLDHKNTSFFWGIEYVGKASNAKQFIRDNGGLCNTNPDTHLIFGDYCYKVNVEQRFYHNASVTQRFAGDRYELTVGVANLFDTKPPRISTPAVVNIGQVPAVSQYDWLGRRLFFSAKARFK
ncbi:TonB-dependent receptor domain-containing protein [Sphingomonas sp. URHD0057]|uniref:TonB-dependent receptor domain-containing protein n=1 Tax=Sphingomonas sp. URHD0057 TaxID=1380389 RepID=UPI000A505A0A|nr:TonB-dependent receptor [Sphingomonas sp. URHD0057]